MMQKSLLILCFITVSFSLIAQENTVGILKYNFDLTYDGYNLFYPHNQSTVFLTNNCGDLIHSWEGEEDYRPGNMAYLTEEGNLLVCKRDFLSNQDPIWAGGGGEIVEMKDWDNNVLWSFHLNNSFDRLHHDVALTPQGTVLMIAWELKEKEQALQAGRDPEKMIQDKVWPDYILEYDPSVDSIIWEWHVWDHLVQDFDASKDNFGDVQNNPQLVDINYDTADGFPDWLHANSIDYNEELDQILLSVPHFDEIWIIDHSTSTAEAAGHTGGRSGKGGDLLFRWGNPLSHQGQGPQRVHFAHDAQWVDNFLEGDEPYYGMISIFNNRVDDSLSTANIIAPEINSDGTYNLDERGNFLPESFELISTHPQDPKLFFSTGLSSTQVLPNNNLLVFAGRTGRAFEVEPVGGDIVWEYRIPLRAGKPVDQGTVLNSNDNITFRLTRYPKDYPAFDGRDMTAGALLETNPNVDFCSQLISATEEELVETQLRLSPNPVSDGRLYIENQSGQSEYIVMDVNGQKFMTGWLRNRSDYIDVSQLNNGIYFLRLGSLKLEKFIVQH